MKCQFYMKCIEMHLSSIKLAVLTTFLLLCLLNLILSLYKGESILELNEFHLEYVLDIKNQYFRYIDTISSSYFVKC